jgi:hypothetical protein
MEEPGREGSLPPGFRFGRIAPLRRSATIRRDDAAMSDTVSIIHILGRFLLNVLVVLAWLFAAALAFTLASCTSGDPLSWAILVLVVAGYFLWPVTLALLAGALVLAIRRQPTRSWLRTIVAVAAILAFLAAAAGFGNREACTFGGF